jgi:hypothetical protein
MMLLTYSCRTHGVIAYQEAMHRLSDPVWMDTARKRLKKYPNVDFKLGDAAALDIKWRI